MARPEKACEEAVVEIAEAPVRIRGSVLDLRIDCLSFDEVSQRLIQWAHIGRSRYACLCNVHVAVTAQANETLLAAVNGADLATPDGAPIAWVLRRVGFRDQRRIPGPDLMWALCRSSAEARVGVYLYGSTPETVGRLTVRLKSTFPDLRIAGTHSPPFRELTEAEDDEIVRRINASKAGIVFVGLGCPKQEIWMAAHRGRIQATMVGIGAAFDFHAGTVKRAPLWMQKVGLEWLYRVWKEPRRLWRRYLFTNAVFVFKVIGQLVLGGVAGRTS